MTTKKKRQYLHLVQRAKAAGYSDVEAQQIAVEALKLTRKANRAVAHLGVGYPSAREGGGLDLSKKLRAARSAAVKADKLAEQAAMAVFDVYSALKFGKAPLTASGQKALERMDRAHSSLGDAREGLGDAVYQIEQTLKLGGVA